MPQPWLKDVKKRSVERDYKYYDVPSIVWGKIHGAPWEYGTCQGFYEVRDRALMALEYLSTCRVSELCRADLMVGYKASVTANQFHLESNLLKFRDVIIIKRIVDNVEDYPKRNEIPLPLEGGLSRFTFLITDYLNMLGSREELFKFRRGRAHQIVRHVTGEVIEGKPTGEMNHYFRDMGLKLYARLLDRNLKDLKEFSGHRRVENLMKYLGEGQLEKKVLEYEYQ